MGQHGALDMRPIEIDFQDGKVTCMGSHELPPGSVPTHVDDEGVWEETSHVVIKVEADGHVEFEDGTSEELDPGVYIVNPTGLYKKIGAS